MSRVEPTDEEARVFAKEMLDTMARSLSSDLTDRSLEEKAHAVDHTQTLGADNGSDSTLADESQMVTVNSGHKSFVPGASEQNLGKTNRPGPSEFLNLETATRGNQMIIPDVARGRSRKSNSGTESHSRSASVTWGKKRVKFNLRDKSK